MSENWKGPSAVIGILGILVTLGIFGYQAWDTKQQRIRDEEILREKNDSAAEARRKEKEIESQAEQKRLNEISIRRELNLLKEILPKYSDSLNEVKKIIRESTKSISYYIKELKNPSLHPVLVENYKTLLKSERENYKLESFDSAKYSQKKDAIKTEMKKLSDSLELYYH